MTEAQEIEQVDHEKIDQLFTKMNRTVEVDPAQLKIEHTINSYEKIVNSAKPESDKGKVIANTLVDLGEKLEAYKASIKNEVPTVTIGYMTAEQITELDLLEEKAIGIKDEMERARALVTVDRLAVKWGIRNHKRCEWEGDPIPCTHEMVEWNGQEIKVIPDQIVAYYERRRWLRPLRWAIYKMNTLTEKKSAS